MKRNAADMWFSIFIRLRDIVDGEYCQCVTCGKPIQWKYEEQCGHFAVREKPMTRYDERNCNAQCPRCNDKRYGKGEQAKHGFSINRMYGEGTAQLLMDLSGVRGQKIYTKIALKEIATEYRKKARDMAKMRGVEL
jgi:hypothetical protein